MGNPAGKTLECNFDLGWLVCAIESEGSVSLAWGKHQRKRSTIRTVQIIPRVTLGNKDPLYIERASEISRKLGVGCYVYHHTQGIIRINWMGIKRVTILLEQLTPYFLGKRERAELTLEFCRLRLANAHAREPYTEREKALFFMVRDLNGKGRISNQVFRHAFESGSLNDCTPGPFSEGEDTV